MKKNKKRIKLQEKDALGLITEAGMLKRVSRSGWAVLGIKDAESVADHSFRCAVISYTIACMENVMPYEAVLMALFNDIHEARITDLHKMAQRYIDADKAEDKAFYEQLDALPEKMKSELGNMRKEYRQQATKQSVIARDADILECLIQAKKYYEQGHVQAAKFMKKAPKFLKTKGARKLWALAQKRNLNNWWIKLSEFKR